MLGVGIVGRGYGQNVHLPAWRSHSEVKVLAVGGRSDWAAMLGDERIRILSLSVPPLEQPALICQAAAAGKHVFCEKPVAGNLSGAEEALAAVRQAGAWHGVDFLFPALPAWKATREALPRLGRLTHAHLTWFLESRAFRQPESGNWKVSPERGGGALFNFASHTLHYLEWLFGRAVRLCSQARGGAGADLLLQFANGMHVAASFSADSYRGSGHRLEVYGQQGRLLLSNNSGDFARGFQLELEARGEAPICFFADEPGSGDGRIPPVAHLTGRLLQCVRTGESDEQLPNLEHGLRVQHLLEAAARPGWQEL
ncbi:MAG: Gfo/Idh/MocA family oxidoreductase [Candidatus Eremiobacteraeota bacterium]|nr:Gfo/Idh/MocA family oxidoreductase [Candidatus Eremiobacteraeota bacterium]